VGSEDLGLGFGFCWWKEYATLVYKPRKPIMERIIELSVKTFKEGQSYGYGHSFGKNSVKLVTSLCVASYFI
jgi:hypothetical protein